MNLAGASQLLDIVKLVMKQTRLDWCNDCIISEEIFHNVIFTDESGECYSRKCFRKKKKHPSSRSIHINCTH